MKINFVIPFISLSGGIKAVFEWSNGLAKLGHEVNVVYPLFPYYFGKDFLNYSEWINWAYRLLKENLRVNKPFWYDKKMLFNLIKAPLLNNYFIPDADFTIATAWPTAYSVLKLNNKKGKKLYCVFHYEKEGGNLRKINGSYKLGLPIFTISSRTADSLRDIFNKQVMSIIPCGVDQDEFYWNGLKRNKKSILLYYDPNMRKGGNDGIDAMKLVCQKVSNLNIKIFYGVQKPKIAGRNIEFIRRPISIQKLNELYNSSSIFVYPSRYEGFGMPPLEAASCKCGVITTDVGAVKDYFKDSKSALVVKPNDPKAMSFAILRLLNDDILLDRISSEGYASSKNFGWKNSIIKLEKMLYDTI